jgi:hypothetical protein
MAGSRFAGRARRPSDINGGEVHDDQHPLQPRGLGLVKRRCALAALAVLLLASGAGAQEPARSAESVPDSADPAACTGFDWPLLREQAWFAASSLPRVESGGALTAGMPGAVLGLKPQAELAPPFRPTREPKPGTYGGVLTVPAPVTPGLYQVTLSAKAWVDVSQDGTTPRPPLAHTAQPGCRGLAKSVRFQLGTAPIVVVVSGARADTIRIAVAPAE